jgi:hypothetical protein
LNGQFIALGFDFMKAYKNSIIPNEFNLKANAANYSGKREI